MPRKLDSNRAYGRLFELAQESNVGTVQLVNNQAHSKVPGRSVPLHRIQLVNYWRRSVHD